MATEAVLLTPEDVAAKLNVTDRWVQRAISERRFETVKVGKLVRVSTASLDDFLAANTRPAVSTELAPRAKPGKRGTRSVRKTVAA